MENRDEESDNTPTERFNYFNYFTEVEEEFVRRRGKALLISPMDWALVESWKNAGIPLHVVLRAINHAFDAYEARSRKYRKVNSVFYCQQQVEAEFAEYMLAQVGAKAAEGEAGAAQSEAAAEQPSAPRKKGATQAQAPLFPKALLLDFISRSLQELLEAANLAASEGRAEVEAAINRATLRLSEIAKGIEESASVDAEALEHDFDAIDRMILDSISKAEGESALKAVRAEAESQLHSYRKKMDKAIYEQTINNFISRRLRETNRIPRLSLFYI